jgi:hypothetical protein
MAAPGGGGSVGSSQVAQDAAPGPSQASCGAPSVGKPVPTSGVTDPAAVVLGKGFGDYSASQPAAVRVFTQQRERGRAKVDGMAESCRRLAGELEGALNELQGKSAQRLADISRLESMLQAERSRTRTRELQAEREAKIAELAGEGAIAEVQRELDESRRVMACMKDRITNVRCLLGEGRGGSATVCTSVCMCACVCLCVCVACTQRAARRFTQPRRLPLTRLQVLGVPAGKEPMGHLSRVAESRRRTQKQADERKTERDTLRRDRTVTSRLRRLEGILQDRLGDTWETQLLQLATRAERDRAVVTALQAERDQLVVEQREHAACAVARVEGAALAAKQQASCIAKLNLQLAELEGQLASVCDDAHGMMRERLEAEEGWIDSLEGSEADSDSDSDYDDGARAASSAGAGPSDGVDMHARFGMKPRPGGGGLRWDVAKMGALAALTEKFGISANKVHGVIFAVLSLMSDIPEAELREALHLPSYGSIFAAQQTTSHGRLEHAIAIVMGASLVGIECDEGQYARAKHFVTLVLLPGFQRLLLGCPIIADTSAKVSHAAGCSHAWGLRCVTLNPKTLNPKP